jgi:hypothetical protein
MSYTNFQTGETFPLPIQAAGDGGLFQIDKNGMMFILQLSHTDIIASEAFRTGHMELALFEKAGLVFLLYHIDGIFKDGWGDAPLALHRISKEHFPASSLKDHVLHMYLVDSRLHTLMAMREIELPESFTELLQHHIAEQSLHPFEEAEYMQQVQAVWQSLTSAKMREAATAVKEIALATNKMKLQ